MQQLVADRADGSITALHRAIVPDCPVPGPNGSMSDVFRVLVSLKGSRRHGFRGPESAEQCRLDAGTLLIVWPNCWVSTWYTQPNSALSVAVRNRDLRVLLLHYDPGKDVDRTSRGTIEQQFNGTDVLNRPGHALLQQVLLARAEPDCYLGNLVKCLLHQVARSMDAAPAEPDGRGVDTWRRVSAYVDDHCQQPISRPEVAAALRIHVNHLSRVFQQYGRTTFSHYLHTRRIERACELLERTELHVGEIARLSGFEDVTYFNRIFKRRTGLAPRRYRRQSAAPRAVQTPVRHRDPAPTA